LTKATVTIRSLRGTKTPIRHLTSGSLGCSDALLTPLNGVARLVPQQSDKRNLTSGSPGPIVLWGTETQVSPAASEESRLQERRWLVTPLCCEGAGPSGATPRKESSLDDETHDW
jgi:hypothetical protein